ncbi:MAG: glycosyltransferase family 9 protein [Thermodesulfobacteriota bacterium]|nr:glycosyltransferase family 9 protein [Thermodesulfobacteriota bacterium]
MKRILIIRPSAIGDVVMASPIISVLREAYTDAYIAWLIDEPLSSLLRHNPDLDKVITWPKTRWKQLLKKGKIVSLARELKNFANVMHLHNFDLAIDAQGLFRSRMLAWMSGAKQRIGFDSSEPGRFFMTKIISRGPNNKFMGSEYYYLMQMLSLSPNEFNPSLIISKEDFNSGEKNIKDIGIKGKYAAICPFSTRPQKHWIESRWAKLGIDIQEKLELPVVILGGPGDESKGEHIRSLSYDKMFNIAGMTTIGQSEAIIKKASLVIGVDTGLTHMGVAFDRPTIALFGPTCPYLKTKNKSAVVIYEKMACSPCRRKPVCNNDFTCMKSIKIEQVFKVAQNLIRH